MIRSYKIKVTTTGGAGVATGASHSDQFSGRILAVILIPHGSLPATADTTVTITQDGDTTTDLETVVAFTNKDTNTVYYPRREIQDNAGADGSAANKSNVWTEYVTVTGVEVTVAQADALTDAVEVEVIVEE